MAEQPNVSGTHWERQTIQKVLLEHIYEQRRSRRWNIFFRFLLFAFIIYVIYAYYSIENQPAITAKNHTALIDIKGEIDSTKDASADNIRSSLKSAFTTKHVKGIILRINSPGGSPVQARHIYLYINEYRADYPNVKVYAVIEELGASAAYLIASACDAIYADRTSIVGSIGVLMESFGFVDAIHKLGIERRLYTAGKNKGALDSFSPVSPEEQAFVKQQLDIVHRAFIQNVKDGRGDRLKDDPDLFTGQWWCGEDALNLGLIDGFGDAYYVAREVVKESELIDYTTSSNVWDKLTHKISSSLEDALLRIRWK